MPTPAYISIVDANQKILTAKAFTPESVGNSYQTGHEDEAIVQAFKHTIDIPCDPQSGQPTGQRVHKPVCITKIFDRTSPLLLEALCSGATLSEVQIKWYRTSDQGKQEHYYTTTLDDAVIVKIEDYMPNCQDPDSAHFTHLQDVYFSYRKITWEHVKATTTGSDDWREPAIA
ncbi:Hcp family type VI secretion system effector [Pseudomonas cannabina]|nr:MULTISPECIES: Hcp family type VI secretion system effector [Pseudomonas syringae group]MBM0142468.1 Hcp family type VI secretion system effector [Pseudomonas cannabina pv. alisalensis]QHE97043.1 type VI secretion system tube protein Hcp [Pseudomonas syringae pv. maculicola str. ES4326]QQN19882.1 Hcp family type VI secretion system effector [Pseudomonas cannabina pv. alisalensis]RMN83470.1 Hcp [Pseudomonas cannabina pv. alisalensis]UBY97704.1 Hcp family type VI secretion system effector [Pse